MTEAGYRLYDDAALKRLQGILLYRELQFPLKDIKAILDSPAFNPEEALVHQIELLELQYKHIGELISFARKIQTKGATEMEFQIFDKNEIEQYKEEVKAKWGKAEAYHEYLQKEKSGLDHSKAAEQLMSLFAEIGALRELSPSDEKVQKKVGMLQSFITDNYYNCTNEILSGLGQMYVDDERFRENIDKAGSDGTAEFVRKAIDVYCAKK